MSRVTDRLAAIDASMRTGQDEKSAPKKSRKYKGPECILGDITHEITEETARMSDADYGRLMRLLMRYDVDHYTIDPTVEPKPDDGAVWVMWPSAKAKIDRLKGIGNTRKEAVNHRRDRQNKT